MKVNFNNLPAVSRANRSIGAILMDAGLLSPEDAERILLLQKEKNLRFGDAAIALGILTEADIQFALSRQFSYPYLRSVDQKKPVSTELIAAYQPFSPCVDQLRAIRSQLMMRWFDKTEQRQVLAVVGSARGEGRSYLAANLAVVFSQLGERTLLIDADLRHPRQHEMFMLDNGTGLSTVLSERSRDEAIVRITDLVGLFVLPAGPTPPNPLELLSRPLFDDFMTRMRSTFDVVILDTSSLSDGEDGAMVAIRAGAAIAVAQATQTRVADFNDLVQGLMNAGVSVVGSVLNEVVADEKPSK
jgi:receptor protein-tyrosine kinase